ncbi:ferritin family protein [Aureibacillus halotolerans]|nr:ferritin-like domain-containing protein [Aureibacillus halotolerans]
MYDQRPTTSLSDEIAKAINGEYSAIVCYKKLASLTQDETIRKRINEIRQDEKKHFHAFSQIYMSLTGTQPSPQLTEQCPSTYEEGLRFAFTDEQETVDTYLDIADKTTIPYIKQTFTRAAADEQNHAVWFLSFLQQLR